LARRRTPTRIAEYASALTYTRVSGKEQEREGLSLPVQLADCRRYCAERGWAIEGEFHDVLKGTRDDRPQYQQMLEDVRQLRAQGKSVVVVVKWLHRLGRRVLESVRCREEFKTLGVPIHSIMEGGEVDDLRANIMASVAQYEVQQLGERVSEVFRHVQESGWYKGGRPSWGYRMRSATEDERRLGSPKGVLDVNPVEAPYLHEAYERAAGGETMRSLSRWVAGLSDEARGGRRLSYNALRFMLTAPVYIQRQTFGSENVLDRPTGHWPALVDESLWQRVQEQIARHARMPRQASNKFLLTGLTRCPVCGARMVGDWGGHGDPKKSRPGRYRCTSSYLGAGRAERRCTATANLQKVDAFVLGEVGRVLDAFDRAEPTFMAELRKAWRELQVPPGTADVQRRMQQRETEVERAKQRMTTAGMKLLDGTLDDDGYRALKQAIEASRESALADLASLRAATQRPGLPSLEVVLQSIGGWSDALTKFDRVRQREILGELIDRVEPARAGYREYLVTIHWTPQGQALHDLAEARELAT